MIILNFTTCQPVSHTTLTRDREFTNFFSFDTIYLQSWDLILTKYREYDKCTTPFPHFQCCKFLKIDGSASLSKYNIEAGQRESLFSGEFKADFCQTFNDRIELLYDEESGVGEAGVGHL